MWSAGPTYRRCLEKDGDIHRQSGHELVGNPSESKPNEYHGGRNGACSIVHRLDHTAATVKPSAICFRHRKQNCQPIQSGRKAMLKRLLLLLVVLGLGFGVYSAVTDQGETEQDTAQQEEEEEDGGIIGQIQRLFAGDASESEENDRPVNPDGTVDENRTDTLDSDGSDDDGVPVAPANTGADPNATGNGADAQTDDGATDAVTAENTENGTNSPDTNPAENGNSEPDMMW